MFSFEDQRNNSGEKQEADYHLRLVINSNIGV